MAKTKTVVMDDSVQEAVKPADSVVESSATTPKAKKAEKQEKVRGKKYQAAKAKLEIEKLYSPLQAISLAKETSISSFGGSLQLHLVIRGNFNKVLELPYEAGKAKRVEIASDETIEKLKSGKVDFDVLIAHPSMMPKLVPFARLLGPRGMMPNPKNGTVSENPEEAAKKFGGNSLQVKSELKAPLIHTVIGKVGQPENEILENYKTIINSVGPKNIEKAVVAATMGPGIKVAVA